MVKNGVTVIDVGITRVPDKNNSKDIQLKVMWHLRRYQKSKLYNTCSGGVGPMTIAMLLKNTLLARQWN